MPTTKQKRVAMELIKREISPENALNNTKIIEKVYKYDRESAGKLAPQIMNSDGVKKHMETLSEKFNRKIPDNLLIREYKTCLKSDVLPVKLKAVEDGFKLKGALLEHQTNIDARSISVTNNSDSTELISVLVGELSRLTDKLNLGANGFKVVNKLDRVSSSVQKNIRPVENTSVQSDN